MAWHNTDNILALNYRFSSRVQIFNTFQSRSQLRYKPVQEKSKSTEVTLYIKASHSSWCLFYYYSLSYLISMFFWVIKKNKDNVMRTKQIFSTVYLCSCSLWRWTFKCFYHFAWFFIEQYIKDKTYKKTLGDKNRRKFKQPKNYFVK